MPHALEHEINQLHAGICGGLADPKRILILYALAECPHSVNELAGALDMNQPIVSRHLKILRERGMVRATRLGASIEYSLADSRLIEALNLLRAVLANVLQNQVSLANSLNIDME
jgi:ArsR family transcriptional regulator